MKTEASSEQEFRKALTQIKTGDHLCVVYSTREEQVAAAVPLLQEGLARGERCVYAGDAAILPDLRRAMGKEGRTLDAALEAGDLVLPAVKETYLTAGRFDAQRVIGVCREAGAAARAAGYKGVRLFGAISFADAGAPSAEEVLNYELQLDALGRELPAVIVCHYHRTRCPAEILLNAMRTHPIVVYGEIVGRNPYYIPGNEFRSPRRADLEVERLLTNLREREQSHMRLRETQERFTAFMDHLPAFAFIKDLDGRYLFMNAKLRALPNFAGAQLGMTEEEMWPAEIAAQFRANDARVAAEQREMQTVEPFEVDGKRRYALSTKFPVFDQAGKLSYVGGAAIEITERIEAEQALRESEERFRQIAENIHEIFWIQNAATEQLEYVSRACEQIWKCSAEELMRTPGNFLQRVHPDDYEWVAREHARPQANRAHDHQYRIVWPDGSIRWIRDRAFPVHDAEGRLTRIVGLAEDVTEATANAQQLRTVNERLHMLSRRLYEVQERERRHLARELHDEIGQALTAAKINVKAAAAQAQPGVVGLLGETMDIVDGLIGKIREISLNLRPSLLDDLGLVPALRSLLDQQTRRADLAPTFFAHGVPDELDPEIQTACFRIAQEALTNVLRHAHARTVSLELRLEKEELHLTITDNGAGFQTKALEEHANRAENFGLIGITERAELVGGQALILSTPGVGTMVDVRLPLKRPSSREETPP